MKRYAQTPARLGQLDRRFLSERQRVDGADEAEYLAGWREESERLLAEAEREWARAIQRRCESAAHGPQGGGKER